ncbi:U-scoloptoxin(05)-Sm1a-like [Hetaerina americana]|uniref:U-scoloptoxin(05)-Sm1a-like n=1 Tax=Hetaerina americana TaxID=62018 RepID=UPI003A7F3B44
MGFPALLSQESWLILLIAVHWFQGAQAINCYTCSSLNGSDVNCEDPYNPAMSTYTEKCMVPKQGHIGMFPANFCIKIVGTNVVTWELMVIRACVMKTMDSQCGVFRYQEHTMTGCVLTCDYDGCNSTSHITATHIIPLLVSIFLLLHIMGALPTSRTV